MSWTKFDERIFDHHVVLLGTYKSSKYNKEFHFSSRAGTLAEAYKAIKSKARKHFANYRLNTLQEWIDEHHHH